MNEQILIIEDETAIQSILSELLTDAGYNIEIASDGLEGIRKFREQHFSLILLDTYRKNRTCSAEDGPGNYSLL